MKASRIETVITRPASRGVRGSVSFGDQFVSSFLESYRNGSRISFPLPKRKRLPWFSVEFKDLDGIWNRVTFRPSPAECENLSESGALSLYWGSVLSEVWNYVHSTYETNCDTPVEAWGKNVHRSFVSLRRFAERLETWTDSKGID